jgi:hypothetical protein
LHPDEPAEQRRRLLVVEDCVGISLRQNFRFDPSAITFDLGRLCIDQATELTDRLIVAAFFDIRLAAHGGAWLIRFRFHAGSEQANPGKDSANSFFNMKISLISWGT